MGRRPTLGELVEYYSREDIRAVLYYQARRWPLLVDFGKPTLLQPQSERDTAETIVQGLREFAAGAGEDEHLDEYPTMHVLADRGDGAEARFDFTTEDDPQTWRAVFEAMAKAIDVLEHHGVYCQAKFSGHRSLHLRIPAEAFPACFRAEPVADPRGRPAVEECLTHSSDKVRRTAGRVLGQYLA